MKLKILTCLFVLMFILGCQSDKKAEEVLETVTLPYSDYIHPSLTGDNLYVAVNDGSEFYNKLVRYDLKTKQIETIAETEFAESALQSVMSNKRWLIWVDSTADGTENKIYAKSLKTGETKVLSHSDPKYVTVDSPYLYKDYVAWVYLEQEEAQVKLYHLATDEVKIIAELKDYALYNNFVHIANDKLLWTDSDHEKGYYNLYDLKERTTSTFEAPRRYPGYAELAGNNIYSLNFDDFSDWSDQEFGVFDIKTKKYAPIGTKDVDYFRVSSESLAVIDEERFTIYSGHTKLKKNPVSDAIPFPDTIDFSEDGKLLVGHNNEDNKPTITIIGSK